MLTPLQQFQIWSDILCIAHPQMRSRHVVGLVRIWGCSLLIVKFGIAARHFDRSSLLDYDCSVVDYQPLIQRKEALIMLCHGKLSLWLGATAVNQDLGRTMF